MAALALLGLVTTPAFGEGEALSPAGRPAAYVRPLCALRGPQLLSDAPLPIWCHSLTGVPAGIDRRFSENSRIAFGDLKSAPKAFDTLHAEWRANPAAATVEFITV